MKFASSFILIWSIISLFANQVDFGDFMANEEKNHTFIVKNNSNKTLKIIKIRSNCGCSITDISKKILKPEEQTQLHIKLLSNTLLGKFNKIIFIETNNRSQRFIKYNLRGNAQPLLQISPNPLLYVGALKFNKIYTYKFELKPLFDNVELALGVENTKNIKILKKSLIYQNGRYNFILQILPNHKIGNFTVNIAVKINQPSNWKDLNFVLKGRAIMTQ